MKNNTLKWGIIGAGIIAEKLTEAVHLVDGCELAAVASKTPEKAKSFAAKYGIEKACTYKELVSDDQIDIVYVATTHNYHCENVRLALGHDKPVLVEKPFTVNGTEARIIANLAQKSGLFLMEAMWTRFLPSHRLLRQTITDGSIGEVRQISVHFGNIAQPKFAGRLSDPKLAGGVTLDMGCYPISFVSEILGENPSEILSMCRFSDTGIDELADYTFRYPSGAMAQICTSFNLRMREHALIYGTEGYIDYQNPQGGESFTLHRHDGTNEEKSFETLSASNHENGFVYQVEEVKRCLAEGLNESPMMTLADSVAIMDVMDRMRKDWGLKYAFE